MSRDPSLGVVRSARREAQRRRTRRRRFASAGLIVALAAGVAFALAPPPHASPLHRVGLHSRPAPLPRLWEEAAVRLRLPQSLPQRTLAIPILMYHRIGRITASLPLLTRALTVAPAAFAAQMQLLHRHRFHAVTQQELFTALEHRASLPLRPVMITFDDGYRDVLWNAAPVLARLHMPATAYVTGRISGRDSSFLTWQELRTLEAHGIQIGSHTVHHLDLTRLSNSAALRELEDSRQILERHLHHPVQWLAYPIGAEDARIRALVREAGYVLAVTEHPGVEQAANHPFELHRYEIRDTTTSPVLEAFLAGA